MMRLPCIHRVIIFAIWSSKGKILFVMDVDNSVDSPSITLWITTKILWITVKTLWTTMRKTPISRSIPNEKEGALMKKFVWIMLGMFVLSACTATGGNNPQKDTACPAGSSCATATEAATATPPEAVKTYTDPTYPLRFSYPVEYDQADSVCSIKAQNQADGSDLITVGHQTFIIIGDQSAQTLDEAADNYVQAQNTEGLSILSKNTEMKYGVNELTAKLGLGNSKDYGTVTFAFFRGKMYTFGYTAGVFCRGEDTILDTIVIGDQKAVPN